MVYRNLLNTFIKEPRIEMAQTTRNNHKPAHDVVLTFQQTSL